VDISTLLLLWPDIFAHAGEHFVKVKKYSGGGSIPLAPGFRRYTPAIRGHTPSWVARSTIRCKIHALLTRGTRGEHLKVDGWQAYVFFALGRSGGRARARCCPDAPFVETQRAASLQKE